MNWMETDIQTGSEPDGPGHVSRQGIRQPETLLYPGLTAADRQRSFHPFAALAVMTVLSILNDTLMNNANTTRSDVAQCTRRNGASCYFPSGDGIRGGVHIFRGSPRSCSPSSSHSASAPQSELRPWNDSPRRNRVFAGFPPEPSSLPCQLSCSSRAFTSGVPNFYDRIHMDKRASRQACQLIYNDGQSSRLSCQRGAPRSFSV